MDDQNRYPSILIPYPGPCADHSCHDIFVYLRPEVNGIKVESTLMRVVRNHKEYRDRIKLAYLANIPGDFIVRQKIVEKHYAGQLYFTRKGKEGFTPHMKLVFEEYFGCSFQKARLIGAFEAMDLLEIGYNELFNLWVPESDMLKVNGQTIKRYKDLFIVNYYIPAILHKNNNKTDIAVMIFRTDLTYEGIHEIFYEMGKALLSEEILHPGKPMSRIFHYSKSPFDQIRDAIGYLYSPEIRHVSLKKVTFADYLLQYNISMHQIVGTIKHPIICFRNGGNEVIEDEIYHYTEEKSFQESLDAFRAINSQFLLR